MARQSRKKQEQLSFPELALYDLPVVNPAMAQVVIAPVGLINHQADTGALVAALPESEVPRVVRKRPGRPKMVLVKDSPGPSVELGVVEGAGDHASGEVALSAIPVPPAPDLPAINDNKPSVPEKQRVVVPDLETASIEAAGLDSKEVGESEAGSVRVAETANQPNPALGQRGYLKLWAQLSTIAAALVFVLVLVVGAALFVETERQQRDLLMVKKDVLLQERNLKAAEIDLRATDLFLRYNDLMQQVSAPLPKGAKKELRYWKEGLALSLLASLFDLTRDNQAWEARVVSALERHGRIIREQRLSCTGYSSEFVRLLEQVFGVRGAMLCKDPSAG